MNVAAPAPITHTPVGSGGAPTVTKSCDHRLNSVMPEVGALFEGFLRRVMAAP